MSEGVKLEQTFHMGETLNRRSYLDIDKELKLVEEKKLELDMDNAGKYAENRAMRELGVQRSEFKSSFHLTNLNEYEIMPCWILLWKLFCQTALDFILSVTHL